MGSSRFWSLFAVLLGLFFLSTGNALAYDISGTVSNPTGKTGRTYISVQPPGGGRTGLGVSIPGSGPFTIHGVPSGTWVLRAFMDTQSPQGGMRHASDPTGQSGTLSVNTSDVSTGADITLADPANLPPLQAPWSVQASAGDGAAFVRWNPACTGEGVEIARYYTVYWSDTPNPGPGNSKGKSTLLPSTSDKGYLATGLIKGNSYYFAVTAQLTASGTESSATNANMGNPLMIGTKPGGYAVSGSVDTGAIVKTSASPALWVAVVPPQGKDPVAFVAIPNPADQQPFSIPGVPPGTYALYAILDMNGNGIIDTGDYMTSDNSAGQVTVVGADVSTANVSLSAQPAVVSVTTNHWSDVMGQHYSLDFEAKGGPKLPVNVSVSGPQLLATLDMAASEEGGGRFSTWAGVPTRPQGGASYNFNLGYADGSSTGANPLVAQVSAVMDAFATPLTPSGTIQSSAPIFTWSAPVNAPATPYSYRLSLDGNGSHWESANLPSNQLTYSYNFDGNGFPLAPGTPYTWSVHTSDGAGNNAQSGNLTFTVASVVGSANGGYTLDPTGQVLTFNWQDTNFVCEGPKQGVETKNLTTLSATTLTWTDSDGSTMTWTRSGSTTATAGSAALIVGTWNATDSDTNNSYSVTFNSDGTVNASGTILKCGGSANIPADPIAQVVNNTGTLLSQVAVGNVSFTDNLSLCGSGCSTGFLSVPGGMNPVYVQVGSASTPLPAGSLSSFDGGNSYAVNIRAGAAGGYCSELWQRFDTLPTFNSDTTRKLISSTCGTPNGGNGPTIGSFSPMSGLQGTPVTIMGSGFGPTAGTVSFMAQPAASIVSWSDTQIVAIVSGASTGSGPILVTTAGGASVASSASYSIGTQPSGSISFSGFVKSSANIGLSGVQVQVLEDANLSATTAGDGSFSIANIPSGQNFTLKASAAGTADAFLGPMNAASDIQGRVIQLYTVTELANWGVNSGSGALTGQVIVNGIGAPLSGATISIYSRSGTLYSVMFDDGTGHTPVQGNVTSQNGRFYVLNVADGDVVTVSADLKGWNFSLKSITAHAGAVSESNIGAASIQFSGSVTDTAGVAIAGAGAELVGYPLIAADSLADGTFTVNGAPAGNPFSIKISKSGYVPAYTNDFASNSSIGASSSYTLYLPADLISAGIDQGKGAIRSRVVEAGQPSGFLGGAVVTADSALHPATPYPVTYFDGSNWGGTSTFSNGIYLVQNVDEGDTVTVGASLSGWNFSPRIFKTHAGAVSEGRITGMSTGVPAGGSISATPMTVSFSDPSGTGNFPPQIITLTNNGGGNLNVQSSSLTGDTSSFSVQGGPTNPCPQLPAVFTPGQSCTLSVSFNPAGTGSRSAQLSVNSDAVNTPNLNIYLNGPTASANGSISGKVTATSGAPLPNVSVQLYDAVSGMSRFSVSTDSKGNYTLQGLATGSYKIQFTLMGMTSQPVWYGGGTTIDTAQAVSVTAPNATTDINGVLAVSIISGRVLDAGNNGVCGANVNANGANGGSGSAYGSTGADGSYTLALPAGDYDLSFNYYPGNSGTYSACLNAPTYPQFYAPSMLVSVNGTLTKDFTLPANYTVSGKVLDVSGAPMAGVYVNFNTPYNQNGSQSPSQSFYANTTSGSDGSYSVNLWAATYQVSLSKDGLYLNVESNLQVNANLNSDLTWKNPPTISDFTPQSGSAGTEVTINGSNFGALAAGDAVFFSGSPAEIVSWSDSQIVVKVPSYAISGSISVAASGTTVWSPGSFTMVALPAKVVRTLPAANATGMPANGGISVTFDRQMDVSSVNPQSFTVADGGASVQGTVMSRDGSSSFVFIPGSVLKPGTTYTATLSTGVKTSDGGVLPSAYSWSFTTADTPSNTFTLQGGVFSLETTHDYAVNNYLYDVVQLATDGTHLTDSWFAWQAATGWSASTNQQYKEQYYALTANNGWQLTNDDPTAGTVAFNQDGSFTWTNSTDGSAERMEPVEYNLAGQELASFANPSDLPVVPIGTYPAGSMAYAFRSTTLNDSYRVGMWTKDPGRGDQNYLQYSDENYQQHTVTTLTDVPTYFATGQTMNYLYGANGNSGMQLAQDGKVVLFRWGASGMTQLSEMGSWEYVTVNNKQLLMVHLPLAYRAMEGELFYAALNGQVKQGEWRTAGLVKIDGHENYNQTAFNWMIDVKAPAGGTPSVTEFTPQSGAAGTTVVINGVNFDPSLANVKVMFNGVQAAVGQVSTTQIVASVPLGATSGPISVTSGGVTAASSTSFTVTASALGTISGLVTDTSGKAVPGVNVQLYDAATGQYQWSTPTDAFGYYTLNSVRSGSYKIQFIYYGATQPGSNSPSTPLASVWYDNATSMESAKVVNVSAPDPVNGVNGVLTLSQPLPPQITGFAPQSGAPGTSVAIYVTNVDLAAQGLKVFFNGTQAMFGASSANPGEIQATIPDGATSGLISITVGNSTIYSSASFFVSTPAVAPKVVFTLPAANAAGMPVNGGISVGFDSQMEPSTVNAQSFTVVEGSGAPVNGSIQQQDGSSSFIFLPASVLKAGTSYTATLSASVSTVYGATLGKPVSFSFTTADAPSNTFTLQGGIFSLETTHDSFGNSNYLYDVVQLATDGTHLTDTFYAWEAASGWTASSAKQKSQYYGLAQSGWTLTDDGPTAGVVTPNSDGSFTWTNSTDGSAQRMEPVEYNLAGQPLSAYVDRADLPAPPTGTYPAGSMAYGFRTTTLSDSYRVGVWMKDPAMGDQNYLRYSDANLQQHQVTTLSEVPTNFAAGQNLNFLWGPNGSVAMQLTQDNQVRLYQFGSQGPIPLSDSGTWEYVTVKDQQLLLMHLPASYGTTDGELFYAAVNGLVKQGEVRHANEVKIDGRPNYNQTAFNWMIGAGTAPTMKSQAIVFSPAPMISFGSIGSVSATGGGSGNPVVFSSLTPQVCTVQNGSPTVTPVSVGTCTIAANQAGNTSYLDAPRETLTFPIEKGTQRVTFGNPPTLAMGGTGMVVVSASSGLPTALISTTTGICSVAENAVTALAAGTCILSADQSGDANYYPAPPVTQQIVIGKGSQVISGISFNPANLNVGGTTQVSAKGGPSASPVTFTSATPAVCGVSGTTVTALAAGSCEVAADQAGDANYGAAPQETQQIPVGPGSQTITSIFFNPADVNVGGTTLVSAKGGSSGNPVTFASATPNSCTVKGNAVTILAVGTCTVTADQGGNDNYLAAPQATASVTAGKGAQIILFANAPALAFGGTATVGATGGASGNPVVFNSTTPNVCTVNGSTVTAVTVGTCMVSADQAGDVNYDAAQRAFQNIAVAAIAPGAPTSVIASAGNSQATVSFAAPAANGGSTITGYTVSTTSGVGIDVNAGKPALVHTVTGLANGTAYNFIVTASNVAGSGPASAASGSVTPATNPDAPTAVTAQGADGSATVSFSAPKWDGGSAITNYIVTSTPGAFAASGTQSPITVNGLANGTSYTFTVAAVNAKGISAFSAPSASVKPASVPGAPTVLSAAANNGSATVSFAAPKTDGGNAITGYTVTSIPAGGVDANAGSTATVHTVTGLANGTGYTFTVTASNLKGMSAPSAPSVSVTPSADVPAPPTAVSAEARNAAATVTFTASANNGGSAITGYTVNSIPAGGVDQHAGTLGTTHNVTGLMNGTSYSFTVSATNTAGSSVPSAASNSVIPATVPGAPVAVSATVGNAHATVSFAAPQDNGGSAITGYTVTSTPDGIVATGMASPIVVNGLTNGTVYYFTVTATNAKGVGAVSGKSNSVKPDVLPGAPVAVSAARGNAQATVTFAAPPQNGGSAVTGYTVTSIPAGGVDQSADTTGFSHVVTGLTNGTPYTFVVVAKNSKGAGAPSAPSNSVTPDVVPGAPTAVSAGNGNASSMVSFTAPQPNGGTPVIRYTVTSNPDNITVSGSASPIGVSGLRNGTAYTFTVTAVNALGSGAPSDPSLPVTPTAGVPGAPIMGNAVAGNAQATVTFTAPASDGGSPITAYTVTSIPAGGVDQDAGSTVKVHTVTGLNNGTTYAFTVSATNVTGTGAASAASNLVVPMTKPGVPTSVNATADHAQATVSFGAPASDGGSPIIRYTVTSGAISVSATGSPVVITGLTDGTGYTFSVSATNAAGTGDAAQSGTVTPADTVAPVVRSFSIPGSVGALDTATSATLPITSFVATDNAAVTGYLVTTTSVKPTLDAPWTPNIPGGFEIGATPGVHTLFAWAKDGANNISNPFSATVVVTPIDTTPPVILSGPKVTSVSNTTAVVEWQTNEPATGAVTYGSSYPLSGSVSESGYATAHSVTISGLTANNTYFVSVSATDHSGVGPTLSKEISLTTKPDPDTVAPYIIEGPTVVAIGPDNATVQWRTNEPAVGGVFYGTANTLGQAVLEGDFSTVHSVKVSGLTAQTVYYLKVAATDIAKNGPRESSMVSFSTVALPDTTAPVVVEGPIVVNVSDSGATVLWKTDEPSTSTVITLDSAGVYGYSSDSGLTNSHSVTITGLNPSSPYSFKVSSTDGSGNNFTLPKFKTFSTKAAPDKTAPVIIEGPLVVDVTDQSAAIRWSTDEPADSVIEYGTSDSFGNSVSQSALMRTHSLNLTALEAGIQYYFRVSSTDAFGNGPSYSKVFTLTTNDVPSYKVPVITLAPSVIYMTDTTMTIYWETDDPSDSVVQYGAGDTLTDRVSNSERVKKHQITITNLNKDTSYRVVVSSTNMSGNTVYAKAGSAVRFLAMDLDSFYSDASPGIPISQGSVTTDSQGDAIAPVITVAPSVIGITDKQATITWTTNEISDSQVNYSIGSALDQNTGDMRQVTTHVVTLTNLDPDTTYSFQVGSTDPSNNGPTLSGVATFKTSDAEDKNAPSFVGNPQLVVSFQNGSGMTTITWTTDEAATTQVVYGASADAMTSQAAMDGVSKDHSITLSLQPGTTYYLAAVAMDGSGNIGQSAPIEIQTLGTLDVTEPNTSIDPPAGSYHGPQTVTLTSDKPATIYYTTDGSTPTTQSPQYNGPITVSSTKTLSFFAIDGSGNKEVTKTATIVVQFALSASGDNNGTINCPSLVNVGETGACSIHPNTGYELATINGCGGTVGAQGFSTGAITQDCSIAATFKLQVMSVTPLVAGRGALALTGGGTVVSGSPQTVNYGSGISFTATPDTGYQLASINGCGGTQTGNSFTTGAITGACSVTATFTPIPYTVTPQVTGTGNLSPATAQTVNFGSGTSFSVAAGDGYQIAEVSGCGGSLNGSTFSIPAVSGNCTVTATFTKIPASILLGDLNGDGEVDILDAVRALRMAVKIIIPTESDLAHDVGPMVDGKPAPNHKIDVGDALLILQRSVGVVTW